MKVSAEVLDDMINSNIEQNAQPFKYPVEKDRGFQNPQGIDEGYRGVGVRVHILLPPTNPYPWQGYRG